MKAGEELKKKTVLITGASRGIGRETARLFCSAGARVYITGRDSDVLQETAAKLSKLAGSEASSAGGSGCVGWATVIPVQGDVRSEADCRRIVDRVTGEAGGIDVLINNAGMSMRGAFEETAPEVLRAMTEINFLGAAVVSRYALPCVKERRGSIVFISSLSGLRGLPFIGPYGASKMALQGLAQSMRSELHRYGIHVGIVHVGFTENDPDKRTYGSDGSLIPIGRSRYSSTQQQVAEKILKCVVKRRGEMVLTPVGHLAAFVYRFFPRAADFIITRFAARSEMYE